MATTDADARNSVLTPNELLLFKLTGKGINKPRQKTPKNLWRKTQREQIDKQAKELRKKQREPRNALSKTEQAEWKKKAQEEHRAALQQYESYLRDPMPTDPEARQCAAEDFIQPILDLVSEATGWKASIIAGGPDPAKKGDFTISSFHSGAAKAEPDMNLESPEPSWYEDEFVRTYGSFLRKCYDPEDWKDMSLDSDAILEAQDEGMNDTGAAIDAPGPERLYGPETVSENLSALSLSISTVDHPELGLRHFHDAFQSPHQSSQSPTFHWLIWPSSEQGHPEDPEPLNPSSSVGEVPHGISPNLAQLKRKRNDMGEAPTVLAEESENRLKRQKSATQGRFSGSSSHSVASSPSPSTDTTNVQVLSPLVSLSAPGWSESIRTMLSAAKLGPRWSELLPNEQDSKFEESSSPYRS